jgi:1-hydroxycarotenoid 3,4-desaturase
MARMPRIVVIGAGVGGLSAAARLAAHGAEVTVLERSRAPGGKMRVVEVEGALIDAGPTVVTMRWVFEDLFAACGEDFSSAVRLARAGALARHIWRDGAALDLYADVERNAEAIRAFAGDREAAGYVAFARAAGRAYRALDAPFIRAARPSPNELVRRIARQSPADLFAFSPFSTYWRQLEKHFKHPRLKQLFGRYATYCGASPYEAAATMVVVPHVEREGSWLVEGGMRALASALADLAGKKGARLRYGCEVARIGGGTGARHVETGDGERVEADAIVFNGDVGALALGLLGEGARRAAPAPAPASLSALTWCLKAPAGAQWLRHNVLFGDDYAEEFDAVFARHALPRDPTIYVCAQDRETGATAPEERLFVLVNAPAHRPQAPLSAQEIERCEQTTAAALQRWGAEIDFSRAVRTTPAEFAALYPGSRGALYGAPPHGWKASFARAGARTAAPGLYLAGGTIHPGPGVPMAILSGAQAAAAAARDLGLTSR